MKMPKCSSSESTSTGSIYSQFELELSNQCIMEQQHLEAKFDQESTQKATQKYQRSEQISKLPESIQPWTSSDEEKLFQLHKSFGNKWTNLAAFFPGVSENSIKNRFYSRLRKSVRKLNKMIERLKLKKYNKFKLDIIFQLSNISESKLLEKDKVSPQVFQFYKEFLYELIEFSNQNQNFATYVSSQCQIKSQVESLIPPLIALENLFRLVRGERMAKGKKKNIAYIRQFKFRLSLENPIFMIISKENTYLQKMEESSISQVSHQNRQNQDNRVPKSKKSFIEGKISKRQSFFSQSFYTQDSVSLNQEDNCQKMTNIDTSTDLEVIESENKTELWKDYFGSQMKEIDLYGHADQNYDLFSQFALMGFREIDFFKNNVCL